MSPSIKLYTFCLFLIGVNIAAADENCGTKVPDELRNKIDYCWTTEVEIVDRVVQTSKSVLNFAKKKLGIAVEDENEVKKCQYYVCIFRQLHLLNANEYPSYENIRTWTEKNVIYNEALQLFTQLDKCNDALTNSTLAQTFFFAENMDMKASDLQESAAAKSGDQTACEIVSEFYKCLSWQQGCPVFQYP